MGGIEMLRQRGNFKLAFVCMMGFFCRIAYEQVFNVTELQQDGTTRVLNSLTESEKVGCSTYCTECGGTACSKLQVTFPNDAKAYKPKGLYEVVRWLHFDDQYVYDNINGKPKTPVTGHWKEEISAVSQVAVEYITASTRQDWELHKLSNGYVKTDSVHGTQYLVDLELKTRSASATSEARSFRVHLNHPFVNVDDVKISALEPSNDRSVSVIIPVTTNSAKVEELVSDLIHNVKDANIEFLLVLSGNEDGYLETRHVKVHPVTSERCITSSTKLFRQTIYFLS